MDSWFLFYGERLDVRRVGVEWQVTYAEKSVMHRHIDVALTQALGRRSAGGVDLAAKVLRLPTGSEIGRSS